MISANTQALEQIGKEIICAHRPEQEIKSVVTLTQFLSAWKLDHLTGFGDEGNKELPTTSGIAISTVDAANCTNDYLRTACFVKGVYAAWEELTKRFPNQRLRLLYAGCGPYATLILPLMPLFSPEESELVLLDVNSCSLGSARALMISLGYDTSHITFQTTDATTYAGKDGFHLILTETMFQALTREPQVAITEHLRSQLFPDGIFIPEEIKLEAVCTSFSKEPFLNGTIDPIAISKALASTGLGRLQLGSLFSIGHQTDFHQLTHKSPSQIESADFAIPEDVNNYPDVCIFTRIRIFGTIYLHPSESLITNPHCVASLINMKGYSHFKLIYDYRSTPLWKYEPKNKSDFNL